MRKHAVLCVFHGVACFVCDSLRRRTGSASGARRFFEMVVGDLQVMFGRHLLAVANPSADNVTLSFINNCYRQEGKTSVQRNCEHEISPHVRLFDIR